jgi:hypothetical protein
VPWRASRDKENERMGFVGAWEKTFVLSESGSSGFVIT